jgi:hypothetical protein
LRLKLSYLVFQRQGFLQLSYLLLKPHDLLGGG